MFSDMDRRITVYPVFLRFQGMVNSGKDHVMADENSLFYGNAALILKMAAGINKHIFSKGYVFPKICIKRRKQAKGFIYLLSCQFFHNLPDFLRCMILGIQFHPQPDSLLTQFLKQSLPPGILSPFPFFSMKFF